MQNVVYVIASKYMVHPPRFFTGGFRRAKPSENPSPATSVSEVAG
jgi:hypothetical protein